MIEDIQYAVFWLANEVHSLPRELAFATSLGEVSDEAIDLTVRCTKQAGKSRGSSLLLWPRSFAAIPIMSIALNGL